MTPQNATPTTSHPRSTHSDPDKFLATVTSLGPLVRRNAEGNEAAGQIADEVIDALHETGAFGMWVPRELGGAELDPVRSLELLESISYHDASTAWVLMAAAVAIGAAGAFLPDPTVKKLFGGERFPVITGQGTRPGKAVATDGGYRLSGNWNFASGIKHSQWIHTGAAAEGQPMKICIVPVSDATLDDNWDVLGLRATGSIDYSISDVFVPDAYTHDALADNPLRGGGLYHLSAVGIAMIGHTAWALGVTRRLLDELSALAQEKTGRPGQLVDSDSFHAGFARAEARARSARALAHEQWEAVTAALDAGQRPTAREQSLLRLAMHNATWTAEEVAVFVYSSAGTTALRTGTIQRLFRDVHGGTQHITSGPAVLQNAGKELAGLAPDSKWTAWSLVPADS
jgi:alkylation response protein AidB-like acyl-CoA dehydrogenase